MWKYYKSNCLVVAVGLCLVGNYAMCVRNAVRRRNSDRSGGGWGWRNCSSQAERKEKVEVWRRMRRRWCPMSPPRSSWYGPSGHRTVNRRPLVFLQTWTQGAGFLTMWHKIKTYYRINKYSLSTQKLMALADTCKYHLHEHKLNIWF